MNHDAQPHDELDDDPTFADDPVWRAMKRNQAKQLADDADNRRN